MTLASKQHHSRHYMVKSVVRLFAGLRLETVNSQVQRLFMRQPKRLFKSKVASKMHVIDKRATPTRDVSLWSTKSGIRFIHYPIYTQDDQDRDLVLRRKKEKTLDYNNSFLGEYECSSLALDRGMRKKRLDHLKQD
ncbi:hypothetical protein Tco_0269571 [Tanacetum coccineum]